GDVTSQGSLDVFVTSFSSAGVHRWQKAFHGASYDSTGGLTVDSSANVIMARNLDGNTLVTSFTAEGVQRWEETLLDARAYAVVVDARGNITLTGSFVWTTDLGGGDVTSAGSSDVFITSFTAGWVHRWQEIWGGSSVDIGRSIVADGDNIYCTGSFQRMITLGKESVLAVGLQDIFLVKFGP
ncbi:MAG: hypothetical protein JRH20_25600, partial [Deltaproteobacteria bacterium]|nr:hypothetical protein [Deltaproteobacteria bacterium]